MDPDAIWGREWGQSKDGFIRWGWLSSKGKGQFGGKCGVSYCNQWGLYCLVVQEQHAVPKLLWGGFVCVQRVLALQ